MNHNPRFSAMPAFGTRFRNLHAAYWRRCLASIASLLVVSLSLCRSAQCVTLAWDASSDPNIAGYKLHYGTSSGNPSQAIDVGKTTTTTVSNLNEATTYLFTVTAYNTAGLESQLSNEISYATPGLSSTPAATPIPSAGATNSIGETSIQGVQLPTRALTVINGTGSGNYTEGTQIRVSANPPAAGQRFEGWTRDSQILTNPLIPTTTALMLFRDLTIEATYSSVSGEDRIW